MLIVGITGGSGCGKTSVVNKIISRLPEGHLLYIPQDAYYRDRSDVSLEDRKNINYDHPGSLEFSLLTEHIRRLKSGVKAYRPVYSYLTSTRLEEMVEMLPHPVLLVEGILILTDPGLRRLLDLKVYVDTEADERLLRIIERDMEQRGRDCRAVMGRYRRMVKPMHEQFIEPSRRYADLIVPGGADNEKAIDALVSVIMNYQPSGR